MKRERWIVAAARLCRLAAGLVTSCGGNLNLGNNSNAGADQPPASDGGERPPAGSVVHTFDNPEEVSFGGLAVDSDYIYLWTTTIAPGPNVSTVRRCPKDNCSSLTAVAGPLVGLSGRQQAAGGRLAFTHEDNQPGSTSLKICSTPDCKDLHDVISGLPSPVGVTFGSNHFYWGLSGDHAIYDCTLPDCVGGALVVASGPSVMYATDMVADDDFIYWMTEPLIWRMDKRRSGPPEALEPGPTLAKADVDGSLPMNFGLPTASDPSTVLVGLTIDGNWLYAIVFDKPTCFNSSDCSTMVVRWPSHGYGERQTVLVTPMHIGAFAVFRDELVWRGEGPVDFPYSALYSCRVDSCMATQRWLGREGAMMVIYSDHSVSDESASRFDPIAASDDRYLYWIAPEATDTISPFSIFKEVRRVPRLQP